MTKNQTKIRMGHLSTSVASSKKSLFKKKKKDAGTILNKRTGERDKQPKCNTTLIES